MTAPRKGVKEVAEMMSHFLPYCHHPQKRVKEAMAKTIKEEKSEENTSELCLNPHDLGH